MGVFDDNSSYLSSKPYIVTPHLNRLVDGFAVQKLSFFSTNNIIVFGYKIIEHLMRAL